MSVASGDIKVYGSATMPESDVGSPGGAIDTTTLAIFDNATLANTPGGTATLSFVSSVAGDTGVSASVTGRNTGGSIVGESVTLAGTTPVNTTLSYERILKMYVPNHSGTITVKDQTAAVITTIPSGITNVRRPFYDISADVAGGSTRTYYEKVFVKNTNTTSSSLLGATISEVAGGVAASGDFALETVYGGNNTSTNRQTAPVSNIGSFDSNAKTVPNTDFPAGSGLGVWLKLTLAPGTAANKTTYTLSVSGSTT